MGKRPHTSIVIPCYNEEKRLPATLRAVLDYIDAGRPAAELILVDDGSRDGTRAVIERAAREDDRVIAVPCGLNRGKGAAVRSGVLRSSGDRVVFFDADLAYPLDSIDAARERIEAGADVVIGGRDLADRDSRKRYSPFRRAATSVLGGFVEGLVGLGIPDTQCGFKAFRREPGLALFEHLVTESFAFDIEILLLARSWSLVVERIPVEMNLSRGSSIHLTRDSLRLLADLWALRRRVRSGNLPPRPAGI
jgi:dolichyl-phosphate beta-glucosyltransferase